MSVINPYGAIASQHVVPAPDNGVATDHVAKSAGDVLEPAKPTVGVAFSRAELLVAPPRMDGFSYEMQHAICTGRWPLAGDDGVFATAATLVGRGWAREPLLKSITSAVSWGLFNRGPAARCAICKSLASVLTWSAGAGSTYRPQVTRLLTELLDKTTLENAPAHYIGLDTRASRFVHGDIRVAYIAHLAQVMPPATEGSLGVTKGLRRLVFSGWIGATDCREYLLTDKEIRAAYHVLLSAMEDQTRVLFSGSHVNGFASDGDALYVPQHSDKDGADHAIVGPGGVSISTGGSRAMYLQVAGDELLSLAFKDDGGFALEVFGRTNGSLVRQVALPSPIHLVVSSGTALDGNGRLLYASTEHRRRDLIVSLSPQFDGKAPKRDAMLDRHIVDPPHGFRVTAIAVDGGHAFVSMRHEAKGETHVMRYDLPDLTNPTAFLATPLPTAGHAEGGLLSFFGDHLVISGGDSLYVFERRGDQAYPVHEIPFEGIRDLRARADGGADIVFQPRGTQARLVRLTPEDVAVLLRKVSLGVACASGSLAQG